MNNASAFIMGELNRGMEMMVFDWNKAAKLIKDYNAKNARAGLNSDWEYTGGEIFIDGKPNKEGYTFLSSTWATPEIEINGEIFDCYIMESKMPKEWGEDFASIKWPESALIILNEK
jgi:hypothetical protein